MRALNGIPAIRWLTWAVLGWSTAATASWGALDPSFGNAGVGFAGFPGSGCYAKAYAMTVDASANVYLAGQSCYNTATSFDFAIAKLDANGTPVAGFGNNGRVVLDLGAMHDDVAYSIALGPGGALYVGGYSTTASNVQDMVVVKLAANGQLVSGFGSSGVVRMPIAGADGVASGIAFDASGNTYVGGNVYYYNTGQRQCAIAKVDSQGALVSSFGTAGISLVDIGGPTICRALLVDAAGSLYLGGDGDLGNGYAFALAKLDANGNLATAFGNGGRAILHAGPGSDDYGNALARDAAGNLYLAGASNASGNRDFTIVKWDSNGASVPAFGNGGWESISLGAGTGSANAIVLGAGGQVLLAGSRTRTMPNVSDTAIVALDTNGNLLLDFGTSGVATYAAAYEAWGIAIDAAGRIIAGGWASTPNGPDPVALRLLPRDLIFADTFELHPH